MRASPTVNRPPSVSPLGRLTVAAGLAVGVILVAGCSSSASSPSPAAASVLAPATAAPASTPSSEPEPSIAASSPSPAASGALDPANFTTTIDNPWFPLTPGTTLTYRGTKDGKRALNVSKVTDRSAVIGGVTCRVIDDRLWLDGVLEEKTTDYYVQDLEGNVWYFGEDTETLDANGKVLSREGSWHAGRDGAIPGIFMEAVPTVGHAYTQELYVGHAEDHFEVLSLTATVKVPFGSFSGAVQTKEWTPLEPDVLDHKVYVRGIGEVREASVKGPIEKLELVKVDRP
jgi:hypothetical protein